MIGGSLALNAGRVGRRRTGSGSGSGFFSKVIGAYMGLLMLCVLEIEPCPFNKAIALGNIMPNSLT